MPDVLMTTTVDTSELQRAIPKILAFGRRTMQEQCVTSATFIAFRAQELTPAVDVGQIDADLQITVQGYTAKGRKSKSKTPDHKIALMNAGVDVPLAVLIIDRK